jgi:predicted TIM-barrel fold metal-dependent hydrolase
VSIEMDPSEAEQQHGHEIASAGSHGRLVDYLVVDTETHTFVRCWPIETNPQMSAVDPFTRAEHSGETLLAEMDRVGVDIAILIGYDGYDFGDFMRRHGSTPADFMGGRAYTRAWARRHPERFKYISTLHDPATSDALQILDDELSAGAVGMKAFPAYLKLLPDDPRLREACDLLRERGAAAVFGLEDISPPYTPSLTDCYESLGQLASDYPDVPIQLNHGANATVDGTEFTLLSDVVNAHENVLVSTSFLGGTMMEWPDGWTYPFPEYQRRLGCYIDALHADRLAYGSDWPWLEGVLKYPQLLQAIVRHAPFASDDSRRKFLGGNALRHWNLAVPSQLAA